MARPRPQLHYLDRPFLRFIRPPLVSRMEFFTPYTLHLTPSQMVRPGMGGRYPCFRDRCGIYINGQRPAELHGFLRRHHYVHFARRAVPAAGRVRQCLPLLPRLHPLPDDVHL